VGDLVSPHCWGEVEEYVVFEFSGGCICMVSALFVLLSLHLGFFGGFLPLLSFPCLYISYSTILFPLSTLAILAWRFVEQDLILGHRRGMQTKVSQNCIEY
jgi:hypothetical protein